LNSKENFRDSVSATIDINWEISVISGKNYAADWAMENTVSAAFAEIASQFVCHGRRKRRIGGE
jgi:hypothetical protein